MVRDVEIRLKFAASVVVLLSYFALNTTFEFTPAIFVVPVIALALMPLGEWLDRKTPHYRSATSIVSLLFFISLPVLLRMTNLLDTVIALVIYIQVYSLCHQKRSRNYYHIYLMSFFLFLAATVMSPDASIGLVFALFILCTVVFLYLLDVYATLIRTAESEGSGIGVGRQPDDLRRRGPLLDFRLVGMLGLIGVATLLITGLFFYLTPRTEAGLLGTVEGPSFTTGVTTEVDLSIGGTVTSDTTPVMRVVLSDQSGESYDGPLLWRMTSLPRYTGSGWVRGELRSSGPIHLTNQQTDLFNHGEPSPEGVDRRAIGYGRRVRQQIFLDRIPDGGVPALPFVKSVAPESGQQGVQLQWDSAGDFTVTVSTRSSSGLRLYAVSEVPEATPEQLRAASDDFTAAMVLRDYQLLVNHNLLPETQELATRLTGRATNTYDKAVALSRYLSSGDFVYTLDVPELSGVRPVDEFILNEKRGHCELYASALALMLRSLGVPTRVVSGFRGGDWAETDSSYTISNDMAHLWVEVYFPEYGWVPFDPSPPADESSQFSMATIQRVWARYALKARLIWLRNIVGFRPSDRMRVFRDLATGIVRPLWEDRPSRLSEGPGGWDFLSRLWGAQRIAILLLVLAMVLLFARRYRTRAGIRREGLTPDQIRAVRLYNFVRKRLPFVGVDTHGRTADDLYEELAATGREEASGALRALEAYNETRFGTRPLSRDQFIKLKRGLRSLDALEG